MDKKKVKELIERGISYLNRSSYITSYKDDARECFKEALKELSKSDWISVEDRLPRLGVSVNVCNKDNIDDVWITFRTTNQHVVAISELDFAIEYGHMEITHWKPIEKLEE